MYIKEFTFIHTPQKLTLDTHKKKQKGGKTDSREFRSKTKLRERLASMFTVIDYQVHFDTGYTLKYNLLKLNKRTCRHLFICLAVLTTLTELLLIEVSFHVTCISTFLYMK